MWFEPWLFSDADQLVTRFFDELSAQLKGDSAKRRLRKLGTRLADYGAALSPDREAPRVCVRRSHVLGEFDTPKSRRSERSVPLSRRVASELDGWRLVTRWGRPNDLVFAEPASGEVLRRGALMRRYGRALKAAGVEPGHRFHDLRHTFGTAMAAAGAPMRTLQEWMGHRDLATTQRYADYAPNEREVEMVDPAFGVRRRR